MMSSIFNRDFFRKALLDTAVPDDTEEDVPTILKQNDGYDDENASDQRLLHIKQRNLVFFDERLTIYIALQLPSSTEDDLKSILSCLELKIEVWAFDQTDDTRHHGTRPASGSNELVFSEVVDKPEDPIVLLTTSEDETQHDLSMLVIFKAQVIINRPKARLQTPVVSIVPSAIFRPQSQDQHLVDDDNLPNFQPLEVNVLESLGNVSRVRDKPPYLPSSRLQRVLPQFPVDDGISSIKIVPPNCFLVFPAVSAKIRFNHLNNSSKPSTVASLDFEVSPLTQLELSLDSVQVSLLNGKAIDLLPMDLPMICRSTECVTFIYKLHPGKTKQQLLPQGGAPTLTLSDGVLHVVSVSIAATILLSSCCKPSIYLSWTSNVELPPSLSHPSYSLPSVTQRPVSQQAHSTTSFRSLGIPNDLTTISFTAPTSPIYPRNPFAWSVLVVNNTSKPIKLALIPIPRIQAPFSQSQAFAKRHAPKSSMTSVHPSERRHTSSGVEIDIAQAILDENVLYALQHSNTIPADTDLISMTAELRVGPLAPGRCYEDEIKFIAYRTGHMKVDVIQVIDLMKEQEEGGGAGGNIMIIRDLPDVIVSDEDKVGDADVNEDGDVS